MEYTARPALDIRQFPLGDRTGSPAESAECGTRAGPGARPGVESAVSGTRAETAHPAETATSPAAPGTEYAAPGKTRTAPPGPEFPESGRYASGEFSGNAQEVVSRHVVPDAGAHPGPAATLSRIPPSAPGGAPRPPGPDAFPPTRDGRLRAAVRLLRPRQWVKNGLVVVAPLAIAPGALADGACQMTAVFTAFTAAAGSVYVLNDWLDRDRDRLHPEKRHRPLASGRIGGAGALLLAVVCLAVLAVCLLLVPPAAAGLVGTYLVINLAYCLQLKHQPLVDVSIVALGFALRVAAGSAAAQVTYSSDLLICVYCACLLLSLGKRRHELARQAATGEAQRHRPALQHYSVGLLDSLMMVMLATAVTSYALFTQAGLVSRHPLLATLTLPFAVFAGARYLQLVVVHDTGGEPGRDLSRDRAMVLNAALWLGLLVIGATT